MAISNKNILITPNTSGIFGNQPNVVFTGADSSIGDSAAITLTANPQNTGTLNFSASEGQLFSISNNLTDGDIFTVNDVSGIPSLAIDASGIIKIAEYGGRVLLGNTTDDSVSSLQISGALTADSATISQISIPDGGVSGNRLNIGNNDDFKIYHDGSQTVISNVSSSGPIKIQGKFGEQSIIANQDGAVDLYFNNTSRFLTTDSGVNVIGNIRINSNPFPASAIAAGTIDSARLPAGTFTTGGTDSATVIALIDSSYVQSRVAVGSINNVKNDAFTGDASTTSFGLSVTPADSDDVFVFVNGVLQHTSTYSLSGSTITLDSAPDSSSTIDIRSHLIHSTSISLRDFQNYIYTLSSTLDSVSGADSGGNTLTYDADKVDVYVNGARLVNGKDYTAGNGTQIVFDSALHAGNIIEVVSHSKATALEPELTSVDTSLDSAGANQAIYSFSKSAFRTFKFTAQLTHSSSSSFHSEEILLTHNGTTVAMTTYAQVLLDSNLGSFDATISGSNVQLNLSPTKTNVGIKLRGVRTPV